MTQAQVIRPGETYWLKQGPKGSLGTVQSIAPSGTIRFYFAHSGTDHVVLEGEFAAMAFEGRAYRIPHRNKARTWTTLRGIEHLDASPNDAFNSMTRAECLRSSVVKTSDDGEGTS